MHNAVVVVSFHSWRPDQLEPGNCRILLTDILNRTDLVLGCGNTLLGDDGFGPAVVGQLNKLFLPPTALAVDAGTSAQDILFDLLITENKLKRLFIIDAVQAKDTPCGRVLSLEPEQLAHSDRDAFSPHQFPAVSLLTRLEEQNRVKVIVLAAAVKKFPDRVGPGLSREAGQAVDRACDLILRHLGVVDDRS